MSTSSDWSEVQQGIWQAWRSVHEQAVTATTNASAVDDMWSQFANDAGDIDAQSFVSWLNGGVDEFLRQTVSERPFAFENIADFF